MNHNIEQVAVEALTPYARNARTHSPAQVAQIAGSIREFGFINPVILDGENGIIAGHGRVMAAQQLGLVTVPALRASHLDDAQRRAYVLADNKLAINAGWDDELLRIELIDLDAEGFDLALTGFSDEEMAALLQDVEPLGEMPVLRDGEREPFRQMTFTLHDEQAETVEAALAVARSMGAFVGQINENGNGNALARICELFLGQHGNS